MTICKPSGEVRKLTVPSLMGDADKVKEDVYMHQQQFTVCSEVNVGHRGVGICNLPCCIL